MRTPLFFLFYAFSLLAGGLLVGCESADTSAQSIVQESIAQHSMGADWDKLAQIAFDKSTTLYTLNGDVEANLQERHTYQLRPNFRAEIRWEQSDTSYRIEQDETGTRKFVNDSLVTDSAELLAAAERIDAGWYTVSQPFNLDQSEAVLQYTGVDTLETGSITSVVEVNYPGEGRDRWWYYFDNELNLCRANLVRHDSTYSFIETLTYDQTTPFVLHQYRKSYRSNSKRELFYIRANYKYDNYSVELSD